MRVDFVDLKSQYAKLKPEVDAAIQAVCANASFILGRDVEEFEDEFAAFSESKYCVGVASGCDAILWALRASGIGPGDEVITATNSYIATALGITAAGATPVLVDCNEDDYLINVDEVEAAITPRTKSIMPVHLYGQAADIERIGQLALTYNLVVLEDAAQAHESSYQGRRCGSLGKAGCFSFFPGKNLGAYGDGGAVTTDDEQFAQRVRMLRNYGQSQKYHHDVAGWNSRLDTLQAAVLRIKLRYLSEWNKLRRIRAEQYRSELAGLPLVLPVENEGNYHVYHLFVVRTSQRDDLMRYLADREIFCGIHYPIPIHRQKAYADFNIPDERFPVANRLSSELLSLPIFPEITEDQVSFVCDNIRSYFG
jgi:dTDP-4-amino-4,6-dideoxygalactose transaminase